MSRSLLVATTALALVAIAAHRPAPQEAGDTAPRSLRILVSNDDGIDAPGLHALVAELASLGEVVVCAPDGNRSGSSHSITLLGEELEVTRVEVAGAAEAFAVSGTPSDAVTYGVLALVGERGFDFVVSGINRGANVGDLAHYSGTVGAAMEGAMRGVPSVAVSQDQRTRDYGLAARFTTRFVRAWSQRAPTRDVVWSINVPGGTAEDVQGIAPAPMGGSYVGFGGFRRVSGDDAAQVVHAAIGFRRETEGGTDTAAYQGGAITLTPLRFDWTDREALEQVAGWGLTIDD